VSVLDGSYKLPNGQRALPFEMVEVRKETGTRRFTAGLGSITNLISSAARSEHLARDHFGHNG
jgi:hypothetical protein